ncbi:hypothetical protein ACW7BJ_33405 [Azospirillum argentinense]
MSELDDALARLDASNTNPYSSSGNPYGLTGRGAMPTNWVPGLRAVTTVYRAIVALSNGLNFLAAQAAVATILQRCQEAVAQVTAGSTSALAFPAVDKALVTATDIVGGFVYDTRLDDRLPDGSRWNEPGRCSAASWWSEPLDVAYRGVKRDFPAVAGLIATQTRLLIFDLLDLDPAGVPRLWASTNAAGNGLISCGSTLPITSVHARNGFIFVATGMGLHIISLTGDWCDRYDNGGRRRKLGTIAQRNAVLSEGPVNAAAALPATAITSVHAHVYPGAPLDAAGMPIPTVGVATAAGAAVIHPNGLVVPLTESTGFSRIRFLPDGRLALTRGGGDASLWVGPLPYAAAAASAWRTETYSAATVVHIGGSGESTSLASAGDTLCVGRSDRLTLLARDAANATASMVAYIAPRFATGWLAGDVRLAALCDSMTGAVTGTEMIINGGFDTGFANWQAGTNASLSVVAGKMRVASPSDAWVISEQNIAAVVGQTYAVAANANKGTASSGVVRCWGVEGAPVDRTATSSIDFSQIWQVTAALATATVQLQVRPVAGSSGQYAEFDNISMRPGSADRSYNGVPLAVMGTTPIQRTAVATGGMVEWSGFATTAWLEQPFSARLQFGSGPLSMPLVFRAGEGSGTETLVSRDSTSTGARWRLLLTGGGALQLVASDGTNTVSATTTATYRDGARREVVPVLNRSLTRLEIWVDGELAATAALGSLGSLDNAAATLRVGLDQQGANPATSCAIAMLRITASEMSPAQIRRSAADMRPVLAGQPIFLAGGPGVTALSRCPLTDRVAAFTAAGSNLIRGLVRFAFHTSATITSATSNNHKAGSLCGGTLLIGTAAQAAALIDALPGKEAILAGGPRPVGGGFVARGVTTDGAALDLAPRVPVGERETVLIEARIVGRVTGAADTERLTYIRRGTYYRDAGGAITLQGSVQTGGTDTEVTGAADATLAIVGDWVAARVTGVTSKRIRWEATFTITRLSEETSYAA